MIKTKPKNHFSKNVGKKKKMAFWESDYFYLRYLTVKKQEKMNVIQTSVHASHSTRNQDWLC